MERDDGRPAQRPMRSYGFYAAGHPGDRGCRGAAGQGRRRDRKADLPLHQGRQRSGAALRPDRARWQSTSPCTTTSSPSRSAATRSARSTAASARSAAASASSIRRTSTSSATASWLDRQRGGDSRPSSIRRFTTLGLKRFQIRVNNRKILNGFYAMLGLTEKSGDIMRTVDKLDKIGAEKVGRPSGGRLRPDEGAGGRDPEVHRHHAAQTRRCWQRSRAIAAGTRRSTSASMSCGR